MRHSSTSSFNLQSENPLKFKLTKIPLDYFVVIFALAAANFFASVFVNEDLRSASYLEEIKTNRLSAVEDLDFLFLGDSRSRKIDVEQFSEIMGFHATRSLNASTFSGSWVTSHSLLRKVSPKLTENAKTFLCVSEFWLEKPDFHNAAGVVPCWQDYYILNQPDIALNAFFPLSRKRGQIVHSIHLGVANSRVWMGDILKNGKMAWGSSLEKETEGSRNPALVNSQSNGVAKERPNVLGRSNVDSWFPPISSEQLNENVAFADYTLGMLRKMTPQLILIYLPNAEGRESYVERQYPDRNQRFIRNIDMLANKHGLTFINMSAESNLSDDSLFEDFHHWNAKGSSKGTERLARILDLRFGD